MKEEKEKELTNKQKRFCEEYVIDWNGARAAIAAGYSENTAKQIATENLTKPYLVSYIEDYKKNLSKATGITAIRNALELAKVAYSNISDLKTNWHDFKQWEDLTEEQKAAVSEITHSEIGIGEGMIKEVVKVKMHDKLKALQMLNKMFGFDEADKHDLTTGGEKIKSIDPITWANGKD